MADGAERSWYIYIISDPRDNEVRYVGWTYDTKKRFKSHMGNRNSERTYKAAWLRLLHSDLLLS